MFKKILFTVSFVILSFYGNAQKVALNDSWVDHLGEYFVLILEILALRNSWFSNGRFPMLKNRWVKLKKLLVIT